MEEVGLCVFSQGLFDKVSNWLSYHTSYFINLHSTIYIMTLHTVAKSKLVESVLGSGGRTFRDCQLEFQRYVQKSKLKP